MIARITVRQGRDPQLSDIPARILWEDVRSISEPITLEKALAIFHPVAGLISFDPMIGLDVRIRQL